MSPQSETPKTWQITLLHNSSWIQAAKRRLKHFLISLSQLIARSKTQEIKKISRIS